MTIGATSRTISSAYNLKLQETHSVLVCFIIVTPNFRRIPSFQEKLLRNGSMLKGYLSLFFAVAKNLPKICITPLSEMSPNDVL